ncbi:MAG: glycosyltransferase, partial [Sphingobacteriaceae bacterium]
DAMNKGIQKANGTYLIFLNSGDEFFANDTIEKVFQNNENADVYYGDTIITNEQGQALRNRRLRPPTNLSWQSMQMGMIVCHQSIFVKKTIAMPYQIKYRISADIDWVIRCLKQAKVVCNTQLVISKFLDGGMSQTNQRKGLQERYEILNFHFGYLKNGFNHLKMIGRLLANKLIN